MLNTLILFRARDTQKEIKTDLKQIKSDTRTREDQIEELRSLSKQRQGHIYAMERLADRLESALTDTAALETRLKAALKEAMAERAVSLHRDRITDRTRTNGE